ncbi:MAG: hypothetical protein KatS3mg002_0733 [Candidatus Woesearchaeota archaeon]|nr:MAG: hypothetical protein KatS3mg002_0733 [Candidatus Woesearchaeota archaeon]
MLKKGYFFILDAFIAATVIAVSLAVILNSDVTISQRSKDFQIDEVTSFLLSNKLEDIDNAYVKELISNRTITNPRNTLMEQIDLFYYTAKYVCTSNPCSEKNYNLSRDLLKNVTENLISQKYGYDYVIIDGSQKYTVYNRSSDTKSKSNFRVITKRISYVKYNTTHTFLPHIVEFSVWLK